MHVILLILALLLLVGVATWGHGISSVNRKLKRIMLSQEALVRELGLLLETVTKIGTETAGLLVKVEELTAQLQAAGNLTPEVEAALAAVKAQVQVVDEMVPDPAPPLPPVEPEPSPVTEPSPSPEQPQTP